MRAHVTMLRALHRFCAGSQCYNVTHVTPLLHQKSPPGSPKSLRSACSRYGFGDQRNVSVTLHVTDVGSGNLENGDRFGSFDVTCYTMLRMLHRFCVSRARSRTIRPMLQCYVTLTHILMVTRVHTYTHVHDRAHTHTVLAPVTRNTVTSPLERAWASSQQSEARRTADLTGTHRRLTIHATGGDQCLLSGRNTLSRPLTSCPSMRASAIGFTGTATASRSRSVAGACRAKGQAQAW